MSRRGKQLSNLYASVMHAFVGYGNPNLWKGPLPKPHKPQARSIGDVIHSALQRSSVHFPPRGRQTPPLQPGITIRFYAPTGFRCFWAGSGPFAESRPKVSLNTGLVWLHQQSTYPKHTCWPGTISGDHRSFLTAAMAGCARGQGPTGNEGEGRQMMRNYSFNRFNFQPAWSRIQAQAQPWPWTVVVAEVLKVVGMLLKGVASTTPCRHLPP